MCGPGVDHGHHGPPVGLGASETGLCSREHAGGECDSSIRDDRPVRDEEGAAAGIGNALASPDRPRAPGVPSAAALLHADRMTQSALSFSCATSLAVRRPSSVSVPSAGGVRTSIGSETPSSLQQQDRVWRKPRPSRLEMNVAIFQACHKQRPSQLWLNLCLCLIVGAHNPRYRHIDYETV